MLLQFVLLLVVAHAIFAEKIKNERKKKETGVANIQESGKYAISN